MIDVILPKPVVEEVQGFRVVREDLLDGGTKRRCLSTSGILKGPHTHYVYAGPCYGYAQVALAYACRDYGKAAVLFVAQRKQLHKRTQEAKDAGAQVVEVPYGYLSNVKAKAKQWVQDANDNGMAATLLPWGLVDPQFMDAMTDVANNLRTPTPKEVWCVAGSGMLTRCLQRAWPDAIHVAVRVGAFPDTGNAIVIQSEEPFDRGARQPPPFPSCSNYDAKAWRFFKRLAQPGSLFWNVAR